MKQPCNLCSTKATWSYMPSEAFYCQTHVPTRGCACQFVLKGVSIIYDTTGFIANPPEDWESLKDEKGRNLPCVEYEFDLNGFEIEDD